MPFRFKVRPKLSVNLPGLSADVEFLPLDPVSLNGPPVSAGRFFRARQLADETVAALRRHDLAQAIDRLLTLADEFPAAERSRAVGIANNARALEEASGVLSTDQLEQRRQDVLSSIIDAVATYRGIADLAEQEAAGGGGADRPLGHSAAPPARHGDVGQPKAAAPDDHVAVTVQDLTWSVAGRTILDKMSVAFRTGSISCVVGRNGAGKTTLLRALAQEIHPDAGSIRYPRLESRGYTGDRLLDRLAFVQQSPRPYVGPLALHLRTFAALRGLSGEALEDEVAFAIERFGLAGLEAAHWLTLAGGFRTRVELARAALASPDILILDEPLGPLDLVAQREYLRHLRDLAASRRGVCIIVSSQHIHAVANIAEQIVVIQDGALTFAGGAGDIEDQLGRHAFEFSADLAPAKLQAVLEALPDAEIEEREMTRVLLTSSTTTASDVLDLLLKHGASIRYFRDLSQSPQQLLEDLAPVERND